MPDPERPPESPTRPNAALAHFECELRSSGRSAAWIHPRGELDLATAPQFARTLQEALLTALLIVVDLRQLTFMDSTGLHAILEADTRARRSGCRLVFVRGSAQIDRLFELVRLSDRIEVVDLKPVLVATPALPGPSAAV